VAQNVFLNSKLSRKFTLLIGITLNLILLGYYKYFGFLVNNTNYLFNIDYSIPEIILPLGISFFTFTQIAYLIDCYRGKVLEYDIINYSLFVTFFPHLIAGPILHHHEMMSQFASPWTWYIRHKNIIKGLFVFSIGLFKKVIIADTFSYWANLGFNGAVKLDFYSAWVTSLSYTFQIYFDFSGYCDMALGASLLFNIWLPINFNSPYKSLDIQDFWRRWHITLSRYLRDYLYIPLGGNKCSTSRHYGNLILTFLIGGFWHGASWMFIIWGALHGIALVIHRIWIRFGVSLPNAFAWFITFNFINITWIFFRADNMHTALHIIKLMFNPNKILLLSEIPTINLSWGGWLIDYIINYLPIGLATNLLSSLFIAIAFFIVQRNNSFEIITKIKFNYLSTCLFVLLFSMTLYATVFSTNTEFLYFNF
tara:strand:+ start:12595 stop:13863 length:1269 start_codon:yes stop_codon:yes gene_type:complete